MDVPWSEPSEEPTHDEVRESFEASVDFDSPLIGPQLLMVKSNVRGTAENLTALTHSAPNGGSGILDGLGLEELWARAVEARRDLERLIRNMPEIDQYHSERTSPTFTVLARAVRWKNPGVVLASAAESDEVDPLTDPDARMFAGLLP